MRAVARLSEWDAGFAPYDGVGDDSSEAAGGWTDGARLRNRDSEGLIDGIFAFDEGFIDVDGAHNDVETDLREQLVSPRRCTGEQDGRFAARHGATR
jgi:hypothetical protein